ncbi:MAG: endonuclease/exonuclease/phosphatase family protein [Myxococcota bacterium]
MRAIEFLLVATLAAPSVGQAQTLLTLPASNNATVQPGGPRAGDSGKAFFNIQGDANGGFASFGVVDFIPSPINCFEIVSVGLELTQDNASFTGNGPYSVYLTDAVEVSIEPDSNIAFQGGNGKETVDPAFTELTFLGSFDFVETNSGDTDLVQFGPDIDLALQIALVESLQNGTPLRLVLTPDDPDVSATYAGFTNSNNPGPTLVVDAECNVSVAGSASVNELHYDNTGTDVGEFVEIAGPAGTSLTGWQLVLYNGSNGNPYDTTAFTAADVLVPSTDAGATGFATIEATGFADAEATGFVVVNFPTNGIQNGAPDGLALIDPEGKVVEFLSYEGTFTAESGPAQGVVSTDIGVSEGSSTPVGTSLQRIDGTFAPSAPETPGAPNGTDLAARTIMQIQGAGQESPEAGNVVETSGVVTAVGIFDAVGASDEEGFYLQDPTGDDDIATSDAVFVVSEAEVAVGDSVVVQGLVEESGFSRELTYTRIQASSVSTESSGNALPEPVLLGEGGRIPPTENIDDDALSSFDPTTDGLDFFESIEAMRVTVQAPLAVSATNRFGEIFVVVDAGVGATGISDRETLNISPDDFNPEKIQIDPGREFFDPDTFSLPDVTTGALLADITGVVGYDFGNFQVQPDSNITVVTPSSIAPETTALSKSESALLVASYNVLNLDPNDDDDEDDDQDVADGRFDAIADHIVNNLNAPDVVALQEVQDNSGSEDNGVVAADVTLKTLVDAVAAAGGPSYAFIDNTFIMNNASGGQPGGNIRTAFLYNPERVDLLPESVRTADDLAAFAGSRLPLIATFVFEGEPIIVVNNHFSSKGGSAPIFGTEQPFEARQEEVAVNGSLDERLRQSAEVRNFVDGVLAADPEAKLIVLGDLNEFEFVSPVSENLGQVLENLTFRVPEDERYTFNFQGNSQSLDHILVSDALSGISEFDIVRVNSEFPATDSRASDHDPLLARLEFTPSCDGVPATVFVDGDGVIVGGPLNGRPYEGVLIGGLGADVIRGTDGDDNIVGLLGADVICGEDGDDLLFGGQGSDRLLGGAGDDRLKGGIGSDELDGGEGRDRCFGGFGADTFISCED